MHPSAYRLVPFPRFQRQMIDWLELMHRKHAAYILVEVDVTKARHDIRAFRAETGRHLSLTTYITACFAHALSENKLLHAYRKGRSRLALFDDVDVVVPVEREAEGQRIPMNVIVRAANTKSFEEIDQEIRAAKTGEHPQAGAEPWLPYWLLLPAFLRRFIWTRLMSNPYRRKRIMGTTIVTNAGMFGSGTGWGTFPSPYTCSVLVGSIAKKPAVVHEQVEVREYLCLTVSVDHDIVDGAVAARFVQQLKDLIEGTSLLDEVRGQDPAVHAGIGSVSG